MDDWPSPRHDARCSIWTSSDADVACSRMDDCRDDAGYSDRPHFSDGYADSGAPYPIDDPLEDLLRPDAGTLADRLEELGRRIHPCDGDVA